MNPGKRFEQKFREAVERNGMTIRIADKLIPKGDHVISEQSEADFLVAQNGEIFLIECKATCAKSLPFEKVQEHQEDSLLEFSDQGEHTHGILAVEFYEKSTRYGSGNNCYLLPIEAWFGFKKITDRKSMPLSAFELLAKKCSYKNGGYMIDLEAAV